MAKAKLLVVGEDGQERQTLELCLRKVGVVVTTASSGGEARNQVAVDPPDIVVAHTALPGLDGFSLCRELRGNPVYGHIPVVLLGDSAAIDDRIRALEAGADEYLPHPWRVNDLVGRIRLLLQRQRQELFGLEQGQTRFSGSLSDMAVVDLIRRVGGAGRSGVLTLRREPGEAGEVYFRDGQLIDVAHGHCRGENALFRLLLWDDAFFDVELCAVDNPDVIGRPLDAVIRRALRRVDQWARLVEQLPPLESVVDIDYAELAERLGDIPDHYNGLLRQIDGQRTLRSVVDSAEEFDDLEALDVLGRLYFDGIIFARQALEYLPADALPAADLPTIGCASSYGRALARRYGEEDDLERNVVVSEPEQIAGDLGPAGAAPAATPQPSSTDAFVAVLLAEATAPTGALHGDPPATVGERTAKAAPRSVTVSSLSALDELDAWLSS